MGPVRAYGGCTTTRNMSSSARGWAVAGLVDGGRVLAVIDRYPSGPESGLALGDVGRLTQVLGLYIVVVAESVGDPLLENVSSFT